MKTTVGLQVGLIPWSPNARGTLTRPLGQNTKRTKSDPTYHRLGLDILQEHEKEIVNLVEEVAKKRHVSMAVISTAWVPSKGAYPIVGLNSIKRVDEALQAIEFKLTDDEIKYLEEPYKPTCLKF